MATFKNNPSRLRCRLCRKIIADGELVDEVMFAHWLCIEARRERHQDFGEDMLVTKER